MASKLLLLNTVRYLRWEQIYFRLRARFRRIDITAESTPERARWLRPWVAQAFRPNSLSTDGTWEFLGEAHRIEDSQDWNNTAWSKLWLYNLHYFDDLDASNVEARQALHGHWITRWIDENPPALGNGWEPYPSSLRIVNWVKWFALQQDPKFAWLESLALQVKVLYQRPEYHLLGNHLFANAKALVFAGTYFSGVPAQNWLARGLAILDREMPEQFLADGAHFELSPMYHSTLLWDLLELIDLAHRSGNSELLQREPAWRSYVMRALDWLAGMCHDDGEIGFFNDATFGIAPAPPTVYRYANQLGFVFPIKSESRSGLVQLAHFKASGYVRLEWDHAEGILDVARIGPDYLPGHAHADTLSFEWTLRGQRVLVNSGTSQYGDDQERQRQRSTAAHNTVEVNGANSSEVWAGFRVARRAYPFDLSVETTSDGVRVACSHDGYRRLPGRPVHRREWWATECSLHLTDALIGRYGDAYAYFHLHPSIKTEVAGNYVRIVLPSGDTAALHFEDGAPALQSSTWHPGFGISVPSQCVAIKFSGPILRTVLTW